MIFRRDRGRTRQIGVARKQRNNVAGSGRRDGLIEPRQRTYVNHYTFLSRAPRSLACVDPLTDSKTRGDQFVRVCLRAFPTLLRRVPEVGEQATITSLR